MQGNFEERETGKLAESQGWGKDQERRGRRGAIGRLINECSIPTVPKTPAVEEEDLGILPKQKSGKSMLSFPYYYSLSSQGKASYQNSRAGVGANDVRSPTRLHKQPRTDSEGDDL